MTTDMQVLSAVVGAFIGWGVGNLLYAMLMLRSSGGRVCEDPESWPESPQPTTANVFGRYASCLGYERPDMGTPPAPEEYKGWDDDEDCWSHTFATGHGLAVDLWEWEDIDPRDLPWTELYA